MAIFKSTPVTKIVNGLTIKTSDSALITNSKYKTNGESALIVKDVESCTIFLDSTTTEHISIKSLVNLLIISDYPIDNEYDEIELNSGASVELRFLKDGWYIMSSDGLKNS
jgi:aconitase A